MKNFSLSNLVLGGFLASAASLGAAVVTYDFNSETSGDLFSNGVTGWSQDTANPVAFGTEFPLGYISSVNFTGSASNAGFLGTYNGNTADNSSTTVSGSLAGSGQIAGRAVSFNMAIVDNAADSFTTRDAFTVAVTNDSGTAVARLDFSPDSGNDSSWNVAIGVNGGATVATAYSLTQGSGYEIALQFLGDETRFLHRASTGGNFIGLGTLAPAVGTFGEFQATHNPLGLAGTSANALIFDDISAGAVIPEPSSSLLAVLGVSSLVLRRKRK